MVNLERKFQKALETHTPKILKMYRSRGAHSGDEMQRLLDSLDMEVRCKTYSCLFLTSKECFFRLELLDVL